MLPSEIGNLSKLGKLTDPVFLLLQTSDNGLICDLNPTEWLDLQFTELTGTIPGEYANLSSLGMDCCQITHIL